MPVSWCFLGIGDDALWRGKQTVQTLHFTTAELYSRQRDGPGKHVFLPDRNHNSSSEPNKHTTTKTPKHTNALPSIQTPAIASPTTMLRTQTTQGPVRDDSSSSSSALESDSASIRSVASYLDAPFSELKLVDSHELHINKCPRLHKRQEGFCRKLVRRVKSCLLRR